MFIFHIHARDRAQSNKLDDIERNDKEERDRADSFIWKVEIEINLKLAILVLIPDRMETVKPHKLYVLRETNSLT
jgi:hypothetical protein